MLGLDKFKNIVGKKSSPDSELPEESAATSGSAASAGSKSESKADDAKPAQEAAAGSRYQSVDPVPEGETAGSSPFWRGSVSRSSGVGSRVSLTANPGNTRKSYFTGRTAIMAGILVTAVILLALPAREFLRQRSEIESARSNAATQQSRVDELQRKVDQWNDPEYIRLQARQRLRFMLPGEIAYTVIKPGDTDDSPLPVPTEQNVPNGPWFSKLWSSVGNADADDGKASSLFPGHK